MFCMVMQMKITQSGAQLDREVMQNLRDAVGQAIFDELVEDAIFEITERIARIEHLTQTPDLAGVAAIAHDLVAISGQIGMCGVSEIAAGLERCCQDEAVISAQAIAQRLVRVGEASLVAAAEMSIELATLDGRHAV